MISLRCTILSKSKHFDKLKCHFVLGRFPQHLHHRAARGDQSRSSWSRCGLQGPHEVSYKLGCIYLDSVAELSWLTTCLSHNHLEKQLLNWKSMIQLMTGKWGTILLVWPKIAVFKSVFGIYSGSLETKQFAHLETTASFLAGTRLVRFPTKGDLKLQSKMDKTWAMFSQNPAYPPPREGGLLHHLLQLSNFIADGQP